MAINKTFSVRHGIDVANTIVIDSTRNLSNIVNANAITVNATNFLTVAGLNLPDHTNNAYAAANSAANTVRVSQNSGSTLSAKQLNFVNTASILTVIADSGDGNANISFITSGASPGDAYEAANSAANTVRVSQNSGSTLSAKQLNFVNTATVNIAISDSGDGNANISFTSTGGGTGPGSTRDSFIGDGACTTFTLSVIPTNENYTIVFVGGVLQGNDDFNIGGANIVFTIAPPSTTPIEVYTIGEILLGPNGNNISVAHTTDGNTNTFPLGFTVSNNNNILVSLDGLNMIPVTDYTCSGTDLTLTFMPPSGIALEARSLR